MKHKGVEQMRNQVPAIRTLFLLVITVLMFIGCNTTQPIVDYLTASSDLLLEWGDTFDRAASTSRMALSPVIGELQRIRRDYEALVPPEECEKLHNNVVRSMDNSIDGFMAFMAEEDEDKVAAYFERANSALDLAGEELVTLRAEYVH
jgi:hypothetical protein